MVDHCQFDDISSSSLEVPLETFGGEQRRQQQPATLAVIRWQRVINDIERWPYLITQVQRVLHALLCVPFERHVDPFRHRLLTQLLLYLSDAFLMLRQIGIGVLQGIVQVPHQVRLQSALTGVGLLPLLGRPVLDNCGTAVLPVFDHAVDP
ncbi:hypothetical protein D3C78_853710 [compost metagenome]